MNTIQGFSTERPGRLKDRALIALALGVCSSFLLSTQALAVYSPIGCANNGINMVFSWTGAGNGRTGGQAHVGDFFDYVVTIDNTAPFNCDVTNASVVLTLPNGTAIMVVTNLSILGSASALGGGDVFSCPGDPRCATAGPYRYVVRAQDETGEPNNPSLICPPPANNPTGTPKVLISTAVLSGISLSSSPFNDITSTCRTLQGMILRPCLACNLTCLGAAGSNGIVTFSGFVMNCGDTPLSGVTISNLSGGTVIPAKIVFQLGTNQAIPFSGSSAGNSTAVTIVAAGIDSLASNVTSQCSAPCSSTLTPCIKVIKVIACSTGTTAQGVDICGPYSKLAIGIQGDTQNPVFCYRITVTNCADVPLTNVTVIDDRYGDLTSHFTGITPAFAAHATATFEFKAELDGASPPTNLSFVTNTVLARAQSSSSETATAQDYAVAEIVPAAITCTRAYSVDGGPITNAVTLGNTTPHTIVWYVTIRNVGAANLGHIVVTDTSGVCHSPPAPFSLVAGASSTIALCTNSSFVCTDNAGFPNTLNVVADQFAVAGNTNVCAHDLAGTQITVRSECEARIFCSQPNACRVTGGGRQDDPLVFPHDVRYVTHGGQVGAPVGNRVCLVTSNFFLGNPCIQGEWTHVRHVQGGLEGNFHARFYDTLDCACLDTNVGPGGVYGAGTVVGGLCSPADHKVAGPELRPAPANKIVFTGVGDWADPNGRRAPRATLFRVDIEDRSEPGGSHPKGGTLPADRYRIRIWVLSDIELAQLNGGAGDKWLLNFRSAISACNGINVRDGVDVPNGTAVFGVRAPDIDDGSKLQRGNHQIHPAIKTCDPLNPTGPASANP